MFTRIGEVRTLLRRDHERGDDQGDGRTLSMERQLLDAADRAARDPGDRRALVLHLSCLPPPGPRPHHRRIARVVLEDAAQRVNGQVFTMANADVVMLLRTGAGLDWVRDAMIRLFQADQPDPTQLLTQWPLSGGALSAYARARLTEPPGAPDRDHPPLHVLQQAIDGMNVADLLHHSVAVRIGTQTTPIYRAVSVCVPTLRKHLAPLGTLPSDPAIWRHLVGGLDMRLLGAVQRDIRAGGPLGRVPHGAALHLTLGPEAILSDAFAGFASACTAAGLPVATGMPLMEAIRTPTGFARARQALCRHGQGFVLDGVTSYMAELTQPAFLQPDLLKLVWSDRLPGAHLAHSLGTVGPGRVVLQDAPSAAAMAWGTAQGIRRFQGPYADSGRVE